MQKRCKAVKNDGAPCSGTPFKGGDFCWFHDPAEADRRADGRRQGGSARSNKRRAKKEIEAHAMTPAELEGIVGLTIVQVLADKKTPAVANAVAALAKAAISIREASEIERRIAALEAANGITDTKWRT